MDCVGIVDIVGMIEGRDGKSVCCGRAGLQSRNQGNRDGCLLKLGIGPKLQHCCRIVEGL